MKQLVGIIIIALVSMMSAQSLKSPEQFLGFKIGADFKLADFETTQKYFKHLTENSSKIKYVEIGKTSQGRDMFMAVISSEENLKNLDAYKEIVRKLSDPRKINEEEAKSLAKKGKSIILVTCGIHASEVGAPQMSMELAYNLVSGNASQKSLNSLNDVIFLLMPSINPDGQTMVVNWYNKYYNTEFDFINMPWLYHVYAGHDNNRDWFMFNLKETQNVIKVAFHDYLPQVWLDEHQMGSTGPRLFIVPYQDPINPNVNPLIWRWQKLLGSITGLDMEKKKFSGVIDQSMFDAYWQGATENSIWHNQIHMLSELASCNIASPIFIDSSEVRVTPELTTYDVRTNYPSPWRGGNWRLRDIVEYELALTYSLLESASSYKEELLYSYYTMCKEAVDKGNLGNPFAVVVPRDQKDPQTTSKMIETLQMSAVEVHFSDKEFRVGNKIYPANSYIIFVNQPNGRLVKDSFEKQDYPDLRKSRSETPLRPYDVTGWTLPFLMGVDFSVIEKPFVLDAQLLTNPNYQAGGILEGKGNYFVAKSGANNNSAFINKLHKLNVPVYWNKEPLLIGNNKYEPGSVFIEVNENIKKTADGISKELHLPLLLAELNDKKGLQEIKKVRVGLYQSFSASMDEGWTRLLLENYSFDFKTIQNKDFKNKKLKEQFDVIIIPDMNGDVIKSGKPSGDNARFYRQKPPEYAGGIEKEGVDNLKSFIEKDGGFVIAFGQACNFAIEDLGLRVTNVLKTVKAEEFNCPGSLLRINIDNTNPIGFGMDKETVGYLSGNIAFSTSVPYGEFDRSVVARYPTSNILKSGFLLGEDFLYKRPAIVDVKQKKGHVILMGFKVQNRHQTFGTFKLLFNAIHSAGLY